MHWSRIALAAVLPLALAVPVAFLFWRKQQIILGNVFAAGVFFMSAVLFAGADYVEALRYRFSCQATNAACPPSHPSDFIKLAAYGVVAFVQVMALFGVSLGVEERMRRRQYDPDWR